MYKTTTRNIDVLVEPFYLEEQSEPEKERWVFGYRVTIENHGTDVVQLLNRHWRITDGRGRQIEVRGEGVVGEQPVLLPGTYYDYNSFCNLKTAVGTMHGEYTMVTPDGATFEARIAPFTLAVPNSLN